VSFPFTQNLLNGLITLIEVTGESVSKFLFKALSESLIGLSLFNLPSETSGDTHNSEFVSGL
jgi:hypothetical protein